MFIDNTCRVTRIMCEHNTCCRYILCPGRCLWTVQMVLWIVRWVGPWRTRTVIVVGAWVRTWEKKRWWIIITNLIKSLNFFIFFIKICYRYYEYSNLFSCPGWQIISQLINYIPRNSENCCIIYKRQSHYFGAINPSWSQRKKSMNIKTNYFENHFV